MTSPVRKDVHRFFHINVNCIDFDRSLAFYQLLGFEVALDFEGRPGPELSFGERGLGPVLGLPDDCGGRAALLSLSDDVRAMRLDLIEWKTPQLAGVARKNLAQPGVARICLKTTDTESLYVRLITAGHKPYTPPTDITLGGSLMKIFCCEDPDGVVYEFMEFLGFDEQS